MKIFVTGGCGFIGSAVVRQLINDSDHQVLNIDNLSYSSTSGSTAGLDDSGRYQFAQIDIRDRDAVNTAFTDHKPDAVIHLAAESHVDRSIDSPSEFLETNILGTFNLLDAARANEVARFLHVSTDEVYGALSFDDDPFTELSRYEPSSPYSASKASSDHLVRAWHETFGVQTMISNCSNNYGPFQFPEKLIPLVFSRIWNREPIPVYGNGLNVRDWLFVEDHASALIQILDQGTPGSTYNIGGNAERSNIDVVRTLCRLSDEIIQDGFDSEELISFVEDRPGHDLRYAISAEKIKDELGWSPSISFEEGIAQTVRWYAENTDWWGPLTAQGAATRRGLTTGAS